MAGVDGQFSPDEEHWQVFGIIEADGLGLGQGMGYLPQHGR